MDRQTMEIYALSTGTDLSQNTLYTTRESARQALAHKRHEIWRRGVIFDIDEPDCFTFTFGWEEKKVVWRVISILVQEKFEPS